jgi:hypothetical protein
MARNFKQETGSETQEPLYDDPVHGKEIRAWADRLVRDNEYAAPCFGKIRPGRNVFPALVDDELSPGYAPEWTWREALVDMLYS